MSGARGALDLVFPLWHVGRRPVHLFAYGRGAMRALVESLPGTERADVLVPSFICVSALDPIRDAGCGLQFYDVEDDLAPSWGSLERGLTDHTKALLLVNYFGFPAASRRQVREWCRTRQLLVIEDNAHGYLSAVGGEPLGLLGDAAIFSIRKMLPIPSGAALVLNSWPVKQAPRTNGRRQLPAGTLVARRAVRLAGEYLNAPLRRTRGVRPVVARDEASGPKYGLAMDRCSRVMAGLVSPRRILRNRRDDYAAVVREVTSLVDARPLIGELADGVCPYAVPFVSDDKARAMARLRQIGLRVSSWPDLPDADLQSDAARRLQARLFLVLLAY